MKCIENLNKGLIWLFKWNKNGFRKFTFLQRFFIFIFIFSWLFSGWPQIGNFPPKIPRAYAAVSYVGGQVGGVQGTGSSTTITFSLTNGSDSTPQAGDLVVISYSNADNVNKTLTIKNDSSVAYTYASGADLYQNGTSFDSNFVVGYRFMPGTPEASALLAGGDISGGIAWTVHVFRGVDPSDPLDVAAVVAGNTATHLADPGIIEPTTSGAWIYVAGAGATTTGGNFSAGYLTDFRTASGPDTQDADVGAGYVTWSSGSYNPAAFTGGGTDGSGDSWNAITLALRPFVPTTTLSDGTNPSNSTIAPGGSITTVNNFILATDSGTDTITSITVNLSTNSGVGTLTIADELGSSLGSIGGGTGSGIVSGSNSISVSGASAGSGSGTPFDVRVTPLSHANMSDPPAGEYSITAAVTDWAGSNQKAGTTADTSATKTIDNLSPGPTTGASATPGDASVDVSWTAPGDSDFQKVYIFCKTSSITETPTEGSDPSADGSACDGTARLKYTGTLSPQTITGLTNDTLYYFRIYARDTNGNFTALASAQQVSATPTAGFSTAIVIRAQDYSTSVSSITFPEGAAGATVSQPYNDIDGSGSPQTFGGAGSAVPVITLYNGGGSTLTIYYNITTFTNSVVSSENYIVNTKDAACADASCITGSVSFDANTSTGTTISAGAGNEKDVYLKVTLSSLAGKSGTSTLTILGEAL